jgi:hypothetical protein
MHLMSNPELVTGCSEGKTSGAVEIAVFTNRRFSCLTVMLV